MNLSHPPSFLFLRLSSSRDTAASSTHRVLADLVLAAAPDAEVDFAFLPSKKTPHVTGLSSGRDWSAFDLILVSNSFVQEAVNLPWLLHVNGVSPWARDRPESFPPVLLGGSNAFAAQCLVRPDGSAVPDLYFFGEADDVLPDFIRRWRSSSGNKRERLDAASSGLDGFWVTGKIPDRPIRQAVTRTTPKSATCQPLPDVETAGSVRIPVGAGCAAFCSFCFEGYERKPYREFSVHDILTYAKKLKASCGAHTAELDAFNLNSYSDLGLLVEQCVRLFNHVSFKSQRADGIAACPEIIDLERAAGKSSYTLGIEGISARMRSFLCKTLTDDEIAAAIKTLLERRVRELKLFFILTAHETPEDLAAFGDFCLRLKGWLTQPHACTRVILSFGRLVRMPNTPLAYDRLFIDPAEWRFCVDGAAAVCRRAVLESRFAFEWPDYLGTQLLAACGHGAADAVVTLACDGLSTHGPWREQEALRLQEAVLNSTRPERVFDSPPGRVAPDPLPFPFVERAVSDAFILKRWDDARQFLDAGYCLGAACSGCGACADAVERDAVTEHSRSPRIPSAVIEAVARAEADKRRLTPIYLRATLPDDFAGHSPAWVSARLMQTVLARHPELIENLLTIQEALFSAKANEDHLMIVAGETVVQIRGWETASILAALTQTSDLFRDSPLPPDFSTGSFVCATWHIFTSLSPREAAQQASAWLKDLRLPHTLRRDGETWRFDFAPAAVKKKCVFALCCYPCQEGTCLTLDFSAKAPLRDLLRGLPALPRRPKAVCAGLAFL